LTGYLAAILDCLFPPVCLSCGQLIGKGENRIICEDCLSGIKPLSPPFCSICGLPLLQGELNRPCGDCLINPPAFLLARSLGKYTPPLLSLIHAFKYQGNRTLGKFLGRLMAEHTYPDINFPQFDMVIPVPLHPRKLRERTFNQALILAREVALKHSLQLNFSILRKEVETKPQVSSRKEERAANVRGAFAVTDGKALKGKKVLLIDDVFTTGATANECARVLRKNGAEAVSVLTLARTV